jgi:hypothetical protein
VQAVLLEEDGRPEIETSGETQHIDRGEDDVHVGATAIEAGDTGMTAEGEIVLLGDPAFVAESLGELGSGFSHGGSSIPFEAPRCQAEPSPTVISASRM